MNSQQQNSMFYGATPQIFEYARKLRSCQTVEEKLLWSYLKKNQLGVKFRRQHPISEYIVDFYCHHKKLVIEIDGGYHNTKEQKENDKEREYNLNLLGLTVIRFTNEELSDDIYKVLDQIKQIIN